MSDPERLLSDDDISDLFEQNGPFEDELASQTIAKHRWMVTRFRAISYIMSRELGVDPALAAKLSYVQSSMLHDFAGFMYEGLDPGDEFSDVKHPMDAVINDLVNEVSEPENFVDAGDMLIPAGNLLDEVRGLTDEDLIHRLERIPRPERE